MRYVFKCPKCKTELTNESPEDFSKAPLCCKRPSGFIRVEGTEAMSGEELNKQAQILVDSLTQANRELVEVSEIIVQSAIALGLGGSGYKERKERLKQWIGMKSKKTGA